MAKRTVAHDRRLRKMKEQTLTAEDIRALFDYNPETGIFTWKPRPKESFRQYGAGWNRKWAGKRAGGKRPDGYWTIGIRSVSFLAHRLAWVYMTGEWPKQLVDHINNDPSDNRFCNLRAVTNGENLFNRAVFGHNHSGYRGVQFHRSSGLWHARIQHDDRQISLGYFHDKEHAAVAYQTAVRLIYGPTFLRGKGMEE